MTVLSVQALSFRYAQQAHAGPADPNSPAELERIAGSEQAGALHDISFELETGQLLLVCGGSGSGKSTLCRALNGLIPHFHAGEMRGSVVVDGLDTRRHTVAQMFGTVGIVLQQPAAQFFCSTVYEEIAYGGESLGLPNAEIERRVHQAAATVGVRELLQRSPHELSSGEQYLVLIAAMLASHPSILVLDEPYANLDPLGVSRVAAALREAKRGGTTVVLSEHRLEHAAEDADRILVLDGGTAAAFGARDEILQLELERYGVSRPPLVLASRAGAGGNHSAGNIECSAAPAEKEPKDEIVRLSGVHASIGGRPVLRGVDLSVYHGECLAIVGANGSGKTTTARHLLGLVRPQQGTVRVCGFDAARSRPSLLAAYIGLAFQVPDNQFFRFTVADEIAVGPKALKRFDGAWIDKLMDLFKLRPLAERSPFTLSGGEKKRTGFAAALASRPQLLVLDEPTAGQDLQYRKTLGEMLAALTHRGQTVVLITHDLPFAEEHAGRWAVMAEGRVIATGEPAELMARDDLLTRAQLAPTQRFLLTRGSLRPGNGGGLGNHHCCGAKRRNTASKGRSEG